MQSEGDVVMHEEEERELEEEDAGTPMEFPLLETQELEQALTIRQEEFPEMDRGDDKIKEELKDKKV